MWNKTHLESHRHERWSRRSKLGGSSSDPSRKPRRLCGSSPPRRSGTRSTLLPSPRSASLPISVSISPFSIVSSIDLLIRTLLMKYCYITLVWLKIEILNKTHSVIFEFERCSQVIQAVTFSRKIGESQTPFRSRSIYTCMSNCEAKM